MKPFGNAPQTYRGTSFRITRTISLKLQFGSFIVSKNKEIKGRSILRGHIVTQMDPRIRQTEPRNQQALSESIHPSRKGF